MTRQEQIEHIKTELRLPTTKARTKDLRAMPRIVKHLAKQGR